MLSSKAMNREGRKGREERTKSAMEYKPLPIDDPRVRQPDIARAKEVLSWEPHVDFEEGIKKTIEYFKESLASPR